MITFILRRILITLPVLWGVATITFFLVHLVPGDPVDQMLGDQASAVDKQQLRIELGLDRPLGVQYKEFMVGLLRADLGRSLHSKLPIVDEMKKRFAATLELTVVSLILTLILGIPLGVIAAVKQYSSVDNISLIGGLIGISVPNFWLGPILILIFSIHLGWLPVSERGTMAHLVLPSISLATALAAILMRMTRASMLETINEDYVRTARAKGLGWTPIYFKHTLRNALMPIITNIGFQLGALLTGAVITETIFDWPGLGTLLLQSIQQRDYPLVQGIVLFIATIYVLVNLLTDVAYGLVNPKVRLS